MNRLTTSRSYYLTDLLYYDTSERRHIQLKKGLQEYLLLLNVLYQALSDFKNCDLEKFDALVGENACQIRAIRIAILASKKSINPNRLDARILKTQRQIESLLDHKKINFLMSSGVSLKELFTQEYLEIDLTEEELFILTSFLLCLIKEPETELESLCVRDKLAPRKLKQFNDQVSSKFTIGIASRARRLLSEASVRFTRRMAWYLGNSHLTKMVSKKFTQHVNSWPCIPMFWVYKTLLEAVKKERIPLVIIAKFLKKERGNYLVQDQETILYKPIFGHKDYTYTPAEPSQADLNHPALIIEGFIDLDKYKETFSKMKWKDALLKNSIIDIILASAAHHRQYPDENLKIEVKDPEYKQYINFAISKGFSLDNPTSFFINHVYTARAGKLLESDKETLLENY